MRPPCAFTARHFGFGVWTGDMVDMCTGTWAIHGPVRLTLHPCRVTTESVPPLSLHQRRVLRCSHDHGKELFCFCLCFHEPRWSRRRRLRRKGRPSGGIAQWVARQDAEQAPQGHGRPFGAYPRSNAGAREPRLAGAEPEPMVSPLCRNKGGRRKGGTGRTSPYR